MPEPTLMYSDLDERPYLSDKVLDMYRHAGPGRDHVVCGEPQRMGMKPKKEDFEDSMGVLIAMIDGHPQAALCICPYSDEQVTLWGPVSKGSFNADLSEGLLQRAKDALKKGSFTSYRVLIDTRNRQMRDFFLRHGLEKFQDNILFSRPLNKPADLPKHPVDLATADELPRVAELLNQAFPDNGHCEPGLEERVEEGYAHYVIRVNKEILGCAVVSRRKQRSWLSLICMDAGARGKGYSRCLLNGLINNEYGKNSKEIAFEVLANNAAALALYKNCGFIKQWTATIFTGPI